MHEKTESPTTKRREEARLEGRLPRSSDLAVAISMFGGFLALAWFGPAVGQRALELLRATLGELASAPRLLASVAVNGRAGFDSHAGGAVSDLLVAAAPIALVVATAAALGCVAQGAGRPVTSGVLPRLGRLSPVRGFQRVAGVAGVFRGSFAILKLTVVGVVLWQGVHVWIRSAAAVRPQEAARELWDASIGLGTRLALALVALAVLDYLAQRWMFERSLRMSPVEIREEALLDEGDPALKSRRRRFYREAIRRRSSPGEGAER